MMKRQLIVSLLIKDTNFRQLIIKTKLSHINKVNMSFTINNIQEIKKITKEIHIEKLEHILKLLQTNLDKMTKNNLTELEKQQVILESRKLGKMYEDFLKTTQ